MYSPRRVIVTNMRSFSTPQRVIIHSTWMCLCKLCHYIRYINLSQGIGCWKLRWYSFLIIKLNILIGYFCTLSFHTDIAGTSIYIHTITYINYPYLFWRYTYHIHFDVSSRMIFNEKLAHQFEIILKCIEILKLCTHRGSNTQPSD